MSHSKPTRVARANAPEPHTPAGEAEEVGDDGEAVPNIVWQRIADAGIRTLRIPTPFQVGRVN